MPLPSGVHGNFPTSLIIDLKVDVGSLEFGEMIGRGNFSEVYKGKWKGKVVALKQMRIPSGGETDIIPKEVSVLR